MPAVQNYNFELTRPEQRLTSWQPVVRIDYQPFTALRGTFKYASWGQPNDAILGSLPGFNDTQMNDPVVPLWSATLNYTLNSSMFVEATFGHASHRQAGCGLNGNGANFCTAGFPVNPIANRLTNGLSALPSLFPDANVVDPGYYQFEALNRGESDELRRHPSTAASILPVGRAGRECAAEHRLSRLRRLLAVRDFGVSVTKVWGRHTVKTGFYKQSADKRQNQGNPFGTLNFGNDANNPLDSGFGFANAALGIFSSYNQASRFVEGQYFYTNDEFYIQDNWKVTNRLTLDYGMRFVHQQPQYETTGQASNFLPEEFSRSAAPLLYVAGCANGVYPCTGANRQAQHPVTGQFLGPGSNTRHRRDRPEYGERDQRHLRGRRGHHQDRLRVAGDRPRATLRHGVRPDRRAAPRLPRRRRPVLRPAERQFGLRSGPQPSEPRERHRPERPAADARKRRPEQQDAARPERLRVRQRPAVVGSVERRCADDAAVGDGARRVVRRPAPATTSSRTWTSTGSISARRSWLRIRIRHWRQARPREPQPWPPT